MSNERGREPDNDDGDTDDRVRIRYPDGHCQNCGEPWRSGVGYARCENCGAAISVEDL